MHLVVAVVAVLEGVIALLDEDVGNVVVVIVVLAGLMTTAVVTEVLVLLGDLDLSDLGVRVLLVVDVLGVNDVLDGGTLMFLDHNVLGSIGVLDVLRSNDGVDLGVPVALVVVLVLARNVAVVTVAALARMAVALVLAGVVLGFLHHGELLVAIVAVVVLLLGTIALVVVLVLARDIAVVTVVVDARVAVVGVRAGVELGLLEDLRVMLLRAALNVLRVVARTVIVDLVLEVVEAVVVRVVHVLGLVVMVVLLDNLDKSLVGELVIVAMVSVGGSDHNAEKRKSKSLRELHGDRGG